MIDFSVNNELYQHASGYGLDWQCFSVNGLSIPFSDNWKKIAVNLSGGAIMRCDAVIQDLRESEKITHER